MANKTVNQRLRESEIDTFASRALTDGALQAWAIEIERGRVRLASLLKRALHRDVALFPEPLKGRMIVAEIDGLLFALVHRDSREIPGLVIACPICDEMPGYGFEHYWELGRLLANAEQDRRCYDCITHNRRVEQ